MLHFPDGVSTYVGQFKSDAFNGQGAMTLKCANEDGTVNGKHQYIGGFKEGKLDGHGTFEHGLTRQIFAPDFTNNMYLTTAASDTFSHHA